MDATERRLGLLGGYCETDDERAAIEQRDRDYMEAEQAADRTAKLEAALREIIAREDKAWMPMRAFRSEHQVDLDEAKHEAWTAAADIARKALET